MSSKDDDYKKLGKETARVGKKASRKMDRKSKDVGKFIGKKSGDKLEKTGAKLGEKSEEFSRKATKKGIQMGKKGAKKAGKWLRKKFGADGRYRGQGWHGDPYRHGLASRGISTTAKGRVSDVFGEEVTDEDVEHMVEELLPKEDKWYNHGDVNFEEYGGWAIKRDGDSIEVKEVRNLPDMADETVIEGVLRRREDIEEKARDELDMEDANR